MKEISHFPLDLPVEKIKRRLKMPAREKNQRVDSLLEKFFALIEPRARYMDLTISFRENTIVFDDGYTIKSVSLNKHLRDCSRVSMLGVSIGEYIEEEMSKYQARGKNLEPLVLDAVGSECVEEAAIFVSKQIGDEVKKKALIPTKRFSPGYGDLSLEVQKYCFKKLRLQEIGMSLNPSLLMLPQKSITAFIGWRQSEVG